MAGITSRYLVRRIILSGVLRGNCRWRRGRMNRGDFDLLNHSLFKAFPEELLGMIADCLSDTTTLRELKERLEREYDCILGDRNRFCLGVSRFQRIMANLRWLQKR